MFEQIKEALKNFTFLKPNDVFLISSIAKMSVIKRGEQIIKQGELCYDAMLVVKGLFRHFNIDENGEEKTLRFVSERKFTSSFDTIMLNRPSTENVVALENSIIIKFDTRAIDKIASDNISILKIQIDAYKQVIISNVEHIKLLTILSPDERYTYFCETHRNLEQRIKQKYLASFLGITPTSLSRIRAKISKRS
jgi:CRP-like cAMP-binding protein